MTDARVIQGTGARMADLATSSVALVLTGPPYFPSDVDVKLREGRLSAGAVSDLQVRIEEFAWTLRPVFDECWRVLMPGGRMIVQTRDVRLGRVLVPVEGLHRQMAEATGLQLFTRHLWRPSFATRPRKRMATSLLGSVGPAPFDPEVFLVFCKPGDVRSGEPTPADVELLQQDILCTPTGHLPCAHPHQAPIPVLEALLRSHSRVGDLVVDPFSGGGTSLYVARKLGRSAWGCEIDPTALKQARTNLGIEPEASS